MPVPVSSKCRLRNAGAHEQETTMIKAVLEFLGFLATQFCSNIIWDDENKGLTK